MNEENGVPKVTQPGSSRAGLEIQVGPRADLELLILYNLASQN